MRIFKRITAALIAVATMASMSVSAFAENWEINYIQGAPSSVSNQFVRREYIGLSSTAYVFINCNVTTGTVELKTTGFNPNTNSLMIYAPRDYSDFLEKPNPLGCSVEFWARESRVVANGRIST